MSAAKNTEIVNLETGEVSEIDAANEAGIGKLTARELSTVATEETALLALVEEWGLSADDLIIGDEYPYDPDNTKDELCGVPLFLVQWKFGSSQNTGAEYVQIKAVRLDTQEKVGIFDSGLGIYGALNDLTNERFRNHKPAYNGALIRKGLTKSTYPPKYDGEVMVRPGGTTYYFA